MSDQVVTNDKKAEEPAKDSAAQSALSQEAFGSNAVNSRFQVVGTRAVLTASEHAQAAGKAVSDVDPKAETSVTIYLKSKASDQEVQQTLQKIAKGEQADYSKDSQGFIDKFGSDPKAVDQVEKFAAANGLKITSEDKSSGRVVLSGSADSVGKAFETKLVNVQDADGKTFMAHQGQISVPTEMARDITGVFGLDKRPMAQPHFVKLQDVQGPDGGIFVPRDASFSGYLPNEIAKMYDFPMDKGGDKQGVAIVELAGGIDLKDNAQYYTDHNLALPPINVIEMDGNKNGGGKDPQGADGEVLLDSQVIGAVAPKATQNLIFTSIDDQGFIDGITRGSFQPAGEVPNAAISVSWGKPEVGWTADAANTMRAAVQKAALKGINVYVASGDQGGHDRAQDFQVDCPSSVPESIGVGGTNIAVKDGKITNETVWNNGMDWTGQPQAGGGGISQIFDVPDYQKDIKMPANANGTNKPGRGVPDVAADSDPQSGYKVRVDGTEMAIGGTSAAAPLYAALNALVNTELGHSAGWLTPKFYDMGKNHPEVFSDVTQGDNSGYSAGPGWDAASGWGSIKGQAFLNALKAAEAQK